MNTSATISSTATASRESARNTDGTFGYQPANESGVELDERAAADWSLNGTLDDAVVLEACQKFARRTGSRFDIDDVDDLAGETAEHFLRQVRNRQASVIAGKLEPKPDYNVEGHIRKISHGLGQRIASGLPNGGRDLTALTKFLKTREAFEIKYGREMTEREKDELADGIRSSAPSGKRPVAGFHRRPNLKHIASLDATREEGGYVEPSTADGAPAVEPQASDAAANDALDILDAGGRGARTKAAREVWRVVSAEHDAPQPLSGHLSESRCGKLTGQMKDLGGAGAVLDRYSVGNETEQDMEVLLAPFGGPGNVDDYDKDRIMMTLDRNPDVADGVWETACKGAVSARGSK